MAKLTKERIEELADVKDVMSTNHGRRMMSRLINTCGVYTTSFNPALPDSNMAFKEGQRNVGLMLIVELQEASTPLFNLMIKEQFDYEEEQEIINEKEGAENEDE